MVDIGGQYSSALGNLTAYEFGCYPLRNVRSHRVAEVFGVIFAYTVYELVLANSYVLHLGRDDALACVMKLTYRAFFGCTRRSVYVFETQMF